MNMQLVKIISQYECHNNKEFIIDVELNNVVCLPMPFILGKSDEPNEICYRLGMVWS